jgi:hypothetical protein
MENEDKMPVQKEVILGILLGSLIFLLSLSISALVMAEGSDVEVSIGDIEVPPGGTVKAPVMVRNVTALGGGVICISYDSTVVHVTDVTGGGGNALLLGAWCSNNSVNPGYVRIASYSTWIAGQTGDVTFADVSYKAVGAVDNTSTLNIGVDSLFNIGYMDISCNIENGTLSVSETNITGFDTGAGGYPSIAGVHKGFIILPSRDINVSELYTYPCAGTGGHTEYVELCNVTSGWCINASWTGYQAGDYHNITFPAQFTLTKDGTYNYTIITGSYPQIIHEQDYPTLDGSVINCTSFTDVNGNDHEDWLPAIKLFDDEGGG